MDKDGKTILTGVANPVSDFVIVPPAKYENISADEYTICCKKEDNLIDVFTVKGKKIGTFELFTPWNYSGKYYLGVKYLNKTYYFPENDLIVSSKNVITEKDVLFLETEDGSGWMVLNYIGEQLWQIQQDFLIIRNSSNPSDVYVALEEGSKKTSCTLYTTSGEVYKKLTPKQWTKLKKSATQTDNNLVIATDKLGTI